MIVFQLNVYLLEVGCIRPRPCMVRCVGASLQFAHVSDNTLMAIFGAMYVLMYQMKESCVIV